MSMPSRASVGIICTNRRPDLLLSRAAVCGNGQCASLLALRRAGWLPINGRRGSLGMLSQMGVQENIERAVP